MTSDSSDSGFPHTIVESVKRIFGGSGEENDLQHNELAREARGEGAGDVSGTEADVNMFRQESDPAVGLNAQERAEPGTSDSGRAGSTYESGPGGTGFATASADPYANTPGTGFATGAMPAPITSGYDSAESGISTEPSLGEGDAGATGAPVGEDASLEERSGI